MRSPLKFAFALALSSAMLPAQAPQLPDTPGRATVKKVCSACHAAEIVLGRGMTREEWGGIISNMIGRGAKGTDAEFAQIVDYLAQNLPPHTASVTPSTAPRAKRPRSGGLLAQAGSSDKQVVDEDAANRGRSVYTAQCITCHGPRARGAAQGPDIVRSLVILEDRYGNKVGPFLLKGHPSQSGASYASLTSNQMEDLSHFLHQKVEDTLRTGPYNKVLNVLTGDPKAGEAYFNGAAKCSTCHSVTGDLAGIGSKYEPAVLQLKVVFPQTVAFSQHGAPGRKKPVTVTVTTPSGEHVSGVLDQIDDFSVALHTPDGQYRSFTRDPGVTVEKQDPYAAHVALLDQYSDKDIHDVVAYLNTLK